MTCRNRSRSPPRTAAAKESPPPPASAGGRSALPRATTATWQAAGPACVPLLPPEKCFESPLVSLLSARGHLRRLERRSPGFLRLSASVAPHAGHRVAQKNARHGQQDQTHEQAVHGEQQAVNKQV